MSWWYSFSFDEMLTSRRVQFAAIIIGTMLSFQYVFDVLKALAVTGIFLCLGLKIVYQHPPTRKLIVNSVSDFVTHFAGLVGEYLINNGGTEQLQQITTSLIKLGAECKRNWNEWNTKPATTAGSTSAILEKDHLILYFEFEKKSWNLHVPYDKTQKRSPERPYVQYVTGERKEFPNHHPSIPFYYRDNSDEGVEAIYGTE